MIVAEHTDIGADHIVTVGDIWENNFKGWRGTSYPITSGLGTIGACRPGHTRALPGLFAYSYFFIFFYLFIFFFYKTLCKRQRMHKIAIR